MPGNTGGTGGNGGTPQGGGQGGGGGGRTPTNGPMQAPNGRGPLSPIAQVRGNAAGPRFVIRNYVQGYFMVHSVVPKYHIW